MPENAVMHKTDGVALKDYIDTRFDAVCKEIAAEEKVRDLQAVGFKEQIALINEAITEVRNFMATHQGKASQSQVYIAYVLALISMIVGAVLHFVK